MKKGKEKQKRVTSSHLKSGMGRYIAAVRRGEGFVVTDRGVPVATLSPIRETTVPRKTVLRILPKDPACPAPGELEIRAIPFSGTDSTAILAEDRGRR